MVPQHWIIITEPWCGDAGEPFLIESYLTNGSKSIPKLVARDSSGNDLFTWGPRPQPAQELRTTLITSNTDPEATKIALQHWYNEDKGESLHTELTALSNEVLTSNLHNGTILHSGLTGT